MERLIKYPRTPHVAGSRLQPGDEDLTQVPLADLADHFLVVERKIDGANAGISFDRTGQLLLQSRGHFLAGGPRERHFALLKSWASAHRSWLWDALGPRFVLYGEWLYAKHTVFYDRLPHYFLVFDVFDTWSDVFLDTLTREYMFDGYPLVHAPVVWRGFGRDLGPEELTPLMGRSPFKSTIWRESLRAAAARAGVEPEEALSHTDPSDDDEGLFIKVEEGGATVGRLKWIRPSFLTSILDQDSHWLNRPVIPNQLAPGVDLFAQ